MTLDATMTAGVAPVIVMLPAVGRLVWLSVATTVGVSPARVSAPAVGRPTMAFSRTATATSAQSSVVPVAKPTLRLPLPAFVSRTKREP